jgi:hypothetical protein
MMATANGPWNGFFDSNRDIVGKESGENLEIRWKDWARITVSPLAGADQLVNYRIHAHDQTI